MTSSFVLGRSISSMSGKSVLQTTPLPAVLPEGYYEEALKRILKREA
jgi:hypothetical protein